MPPDKQPAAFILGISGLSSTGKTTLGRLLRAVFPSSFLLHQDDFFYPEPQIPINSEGIMDWDCPEAIDWDSLLRALNYVHERGELPDGLHSFQEKNPTGESGVSDEEVRREMHKVERELDEMEKEGGNRKRMRLVIMDGFMLFNDERVLKVLDAKIFLRAKYEKVRGSYT
jgi:nicotinamide/nicotinate riboside kinase